MTTPNSLSEYPNKEMKVFHPLEARPANPVYRNIYQQCLWTAVVANVDGNLTMTLGNTPETQVVFTLLPWDNHTFSSTCPAWKWGPVYDGRVTFSTAPHGTVRQLTTTLLLQKMWHQGRNICTDRRCITVKTIFHPHMSK